MYLSYRNQFVFFVSGQLLCDLVVRIQCSHRRSQGSINKGKAITLPNLIEGMKDGV